MDPTENLAKQMRLCKLIQGLIDIRECVGLQPADLDALVDASNDLAEHVQDLDRWLRNKGALPGTWKR